MNFYSQHGEDRWIVEHLPLPQYGTAIEVGAADGVTGSNTMHFFERGWRGMIVEPDPRQFPAARASRAGWACHNVACGDPENPRLFGMELEPTWSGLGRDSRSKMVVPIRSLAYLMGVSGFDTPVTLLSIDTEGTELEVWRSFDNVRLAPQIVVIEHDTAGLPSNREPILAEFAARYRVAHETAGNFILVKRGQ